MFKFTRYSERGSAQERRDAHLRQERCLIWDGTDENAFLIPAQLVLAKKGTEEHQDLLEMPILHMASGDWCALGTALAIRGMENAGLSEPQTRYDDTYSFSMSLAELDWQGTAEGQEDLVKLVREHKFIACVSGEERHSTYDLCHFSVGFECDPYREWLRRFVQKYVPAREDDIFDETPYKWTDYTLKIEGNKDFLIYNMNIVAARSGVALFGIGDGIYGHNGMEPHTFSTYRRTPMQWFKNPPALKLAHWRSGSFNGTDND